jgi:hypothetical protein
VDLKSQLKIRTTQSRQESGWIPLLLTGSLVAFLLIQAIKSSDQANSQREPIEKISIKMQAR